MKTKIITMTMLGGLLAASTFAAEIKSDRNMLPVIKENKEVVRQIDIQNNVKKNNNEILVISAKKELTVVDLLVQVKTEQERREILAKNKEYHTPFSEKTQNVFTNFDFILDKLEKVKLDIDKEILLLKKQDVDMKFLNEHGVTFKEHVKQARLKEVIAWLEIQNINFDGDRSEILEKLEGVKILLADSKVEIKSAFVDLKEMLSFIKGARVILK